MDQEGATWSDYWAFVAPQPQALPEVKLKKWVRQPLDRFVLARLEQESLQPSPEADKAALLRRVSLDLTGLPPTAQEQSTFLADASPNAYERQVDRLLSSPAYGERWASMWLDLARYADSMGYEADLMRPGVWAYRDWVIDAQSTYRMTSSGTTQMAGDLLPNATFEDRIATSFHRQTPNNQEGGTDDEEFRLVEVMDRVATTWSVLNGVTMNCVQCHSHPYDPIRHPDYYKTLAFFNTSNDTDRDDDFPTLRIPKDKSRYAETSAMQQEIIGLLHSVVTSDRDLVSKDEWTKAPIQSAAANEIPALIERLPGDEEYLTSLRKSKDKPEQKAAAVADQLERIKGVRNRLAIARARGGPAKTLHIRDGEAFADPNTPPQSYYELVATSNLPVITAIRVEVPPINAEKARHTPEDGFIVERVEASMLGPNGRKSRIAFRCFLQDSEENLEAAVSATADAKHKTAHGGVADGFSAHPKLFGTRWVVGILAEPLRTGSKMRIEVSLKQVREIDYKPAPIQRVRLALSGDPKWTSVGQDASRANIVARLKDLEQRLGKIPTVYIPVMSEEEPYARRTTLEFERGNFLNKIGPDLAPDVPGIFPRFPDNYPRNRLGLAQWFFSPGQPLTARVAVNRYWEQLFGTGIVETLENFGSAGEAPSHPELLDWLALHFQNDLHWDMKALLREIVTSATYRQSAVTTPGLQEKDPRNRLLARGPQQRLTAEMVRDQALVGQWPVESNDGRSPGDAAAASGSLEFCLQQR